MSLNPRLRLRHISTFLAVARTGSVNAAADTLSITQPAVSKTLRELEEIVGVRLFDRVGRRLQINASGAAFQKLSGAGLAALESAESTARAVAKGRVRLRVGALPTAATGLLPDAAILLHTRGAEFSLRVSTGPNWLLLSQLREGSLDLVVGRMADPSRMEGLTFRQLIAEHIVAAVRADHPLHDFAPPEPLRRYPLVLPPPGAVIHQTVQAYLLSVGAGSVAAAFETVSLPFGRRILQKSDAIWFISQGVIEDELNSGALRILPLNTPMLAGPVGISLREDAVISSEQAELIAALEQVAGERAEPGRRNG